MKTWLLVVTLILVLSMVGAGLVLASGPERTREVVSGGASESEAGVVSLRATLGQPLVGGVSGGAAMLGQGFWHGGVVGTGYCIYLPVVLRN